MSINDFVVMTIYLSVFNMFSIYAKMQGFLNVVFLCVMQKFKISCQKWRENDFWEKLEVDSANTLWVKSLFEVALSCTVSKINMFLLLCRNSRWPPKM